MYVSMYRGYGGDPLDDQMTLDAKKGWDEAKTARMSSSRGEDDSGHGRPPKVGVGGCALLCSSVIVVK